jgi:transposase-like protein
MRRRERDTDTTLACPHCDSAQLRHRQRSSEKSRLAQRHDPHWVCDVCGRSCSEPVEREERRSPNDGHAKLKAAGFDHLLNDGGEST